jgi:beta-galactosidase
LKAYVENGGVLIAEARPAWNDERGFANARIPGGGLDELFGAREAELRSGETLTLTMTQDLPAEMRSAAGLVVPGSTYLEILSPYPGTRVLATTVTREPAAVERIRGKGKAILLGSFVSAAFEANPEKNVEAGRVIATLVRAAGVSPRVTIDGAPGRLDARLMESTRALLLVAINHDTAPHRASIALPADAPAGEWLNLETGESIPLAGRAAAGPRFEYEFKARDVLVLLARKP